MAQARQCLCFIHLAPRAVQGRDGSRPHPGSERAPPLSSPHNARGFATRERVTHGTEDGNARPDGGGVHAPESAPHPGRARAVRRGAPHRGEGRAGHLAHAQGEGARRAGVPAVGQVHDVERPGLLRRPSVQRDEEGGRKGYRQPGEQGYYSLDCAEWLDLEPVDGKLGELCGLIDGTCRSRVPVRWHRRAIRARRSRPTPPRGASPAAWIAPS